MQKDKNNNIISIYNVKKRYWFGQNKKININSTISKMYMKMSHLGSKFTSYSLLPIKFSSEKCTCKIVNHNRVIIQVDSQHN